MIELFYSIEDDHPPFRVDIVELFFRQLAEHGVQLQWYMRQAEPGPARTIEYLGQPVHLPRRFAGGRAAKVLTRLAWWATDIRWLFHHAFFTRNHIQVRDKYVAALFGLLFARLAGKRFFYWCSYPFPELYLQRAGGERGLRRLYSLFMGHAGALTLYRIVMPRADHCFVQSQRMLDDVARHGTPRDHMTAVPMGVPPRLLRHASAQAQGRSPAVVPGRLVYLGTLARNRQLDMLIHAFALLRQRHPEATLLMAGDGVVPEDRRSLEDLAHRLGISGITFTGFLPIEQAWDLAASAAVCVTPCPATRELVAGSPTKLVEYMALGRPVVCNDHPEQQQVIEHSGAGLCVPWSAEAFAEAISTLLSNPAQAEAMGARGPAWVAGHRSYDVLAGQVLAVYRRLCSAPAP